MDESLMITQAEDFLSKIDKQKLDLANLNDNLKDLDSFLEIYLILKNNLNSLQNMKERMDNSGYTAPFRSLNLYGSRRSEEISFEELGEINRHNQVFRHKASAKRNIFDRVKYAISAHRIALGHLEEYAKIYCKDCSKSYRASTFTENNHICKCGSDNFELKINFSGVYRLEIIPYLPLSGNYLYLVSGLSSWGRESYKRILNSLQQRGSVVKTVTPIIKYVKNGRTIKKRLSLGPEHSEDYEDEARRLYGDSVRIDRLDFRRTKPTIINDKYTCTNLALAYVKIAEDIIHRHGSTLFEENIKNIKNITLYDDVISSINLEQPDYIDRGDLDEWREYKIKDTLEDLGLMDKYGNLDKQLKKDLKERESIKNKIFSEVAHTLILWDLFRLYLCTSRDRRKRYSLPFPYLRTVIDRNQRKTFQNSHDKVVKFLVEKEKEHILAVPEMDLLLYKKFKFENRLKNANIKLNYAAVGPAIVFTNAKFTIPEVAHAFRVSENSIKREIMNIKSFKKPRSKKSKQFLDMIKK